jgi:hypothetical protein
MTIEIKQLVIRAIVDGRGESSPPRTGAPVVRAPEPIRRSRPDPAAPSQDRDAIVAACVREVLRKLKRSQER